MEGFDPMTSFGAPVAEDYRTHLRGDEEETVAFLADLAAGRPVLELAIGTGRIAIPLAATGLVVRGIDQSQAMLDVLADTPGGAEIETMRGDMAHEAPDGRYGLVYLVYNTLGNILTQEGQLACFGNAADHLVDGGVFVVETSTVWHTVPATRFVNAEQVTAGEVVLDVNHYDPATQMLSENHVHLSADGVRLGPIAQRLVHPAEMDLMARLAGLRLRVRYGGWRGEPFDADSTRHVSVYESA